ncbi:MAG: Papain-like cysteine protease AvrRpt2 [Anaerocolumna sp.]|jgi:hypothetical protein|nr:Papain-like cysteine protease AvrRpt2 [Anaerocolumna sp.]
MKKRRIISLLLTILCIISIIPTNVANAQTNDYLINVAGEFMSLAINSPSDYGLDISEYGNLQLSDEITPYQYNEDGILESIPTIKYYFVMNNSKPIATLIESWNEKDNTPSVTFETDTAKKLEKFNSNSFTLVCIDNSVSIENSDYNTNLYNNLRSFNTTFSSALSADFSTYSLPASYGLNMPIKLQGQDENCWAASVASILQYKKGISKTARQVCNDAGIGYNDGADQNEISASLSSYGINNYIAGGFYQNVGDIYTLLSSSYIPNAIFGANLWDSSTSNDAAHSVIIRGYSASTQGAYLSIMDPNKSSYSMIFTGYAPDGTLTWTLTYSAFTMYWIDTIVAY